MAGAVLPVRVARDSGEWAIDRQSNHLLRIGMDHDRSTDLTITRKALAIQPLACAWPFQLGESLIGSVFVNVLYGGGLNLGHSGRIRIRLCRDVVSTGLGIAD